MLHSNAIDSMFSEVGTPEKPISLNGAVCLNLNDVLEVGTVDEVG